MKILKLELYKYNRFTLKGITYFKYEPQTTIQIILGANGCGKSSLLKELSPLPASHQEFEKDGYKKILILHNSSTYELLSDFSIKGNKFSFLKDDKELNPGYTVSVFRDLVRTEFGITQEVHDLMIGYSRFCTMDIATRRNWFTKLPSVDYSYAIRYFKRLTEKLRDTTGAIKHISGKLVQERDKQVSKEELDALKEELSVLREYLSYILENKSKAKYSIHECESKLTAINSSIVQLYKSIQEKIFSFNNFDNALSILELESQINKINESIASTDVLIERIFKDATDINISIEELEKNKADSAQELKQKMDQRHLYIERLRSTLTYNLTIAKPVEALEALNSSAPYLIETLSLLEADPDKVISKVYYDNLLLNITNAEKDLDSIKSSISSCIAEINKQEHLKSHDQVTCPKCSHSFNASYNPSIHQEALKKKEELENKASIYSENISSLYKEKDKVYERFELLRAFSQITRSYSILDPVWVIIRQECLFKDPKAVSHFVNKLRLELTTLSQIYTLEQDQDNESRALSIALSFKDISLDDLKKRYSSLSDQLHDLQLTSKDLKSSLRSKERSLRLAKDVNTLKDALELKLNERAESLSSIEEVIKNELQSKLIQAVQYEISIRESRISNISNQNSIISSLEEQLTVLNQKKEVLKAAADVLSPSEGLIAKGITGFINHFLKQVNSFIKNIWSYPFEIIPIEVNEDLDLDYKFALKIGDKGQSPDISKISKGQQEIIDLAFRIVAAQYLGLSQAPLYLDEFGSSFDKDHRQAVSEMMHSLTSTSSFSQIYIISHYEEMYGSFKNTDITAFYDPKFEVTQSDLFNKVTVFD